MSAETEIEISVISEEDLETSRSTSTPGEMLLHEKTGKNNRGLSSHPFSFDTNKPASRPSCNPHYTSFSISSILGRSKSPTVDVDTSVSIERKLSVEKDSPSIATTSQKIVRSCESSPSDNPVSSASITVSNQRSIITHSNETRKNNPSSISWAANSTSPPISFGPTSVPSSSIMGQASANLAMLSR